MPEITANAAAAGHDLGGFELVEQQFALGDEEPVSCGRVPTTVGFVQAAVENGRWGYDDDRRDGRTPPAFTLELLLTAVR